MSTQIRWRGVDQIMTRLNEYERRVHEVIHRVAEYYAGIIEEYAKRNARWTDRTSNARNGLLAGVNDLARDTVQLYLKHSVAYGVFLETRWAGRFSIIWPSIEAHLPAITRMLQEALG